MSFLGTLNKSDNMMLKTLSTNLSMDDMSRLAILFNSYMTDFKSNYRIIVQTNFEQL